MNILSVSGGKDSVAMVLVCLEQNIKIDEIIFCNTGIEHSELLNVMEHMKVLCNHYQIKYTELKGDFITLLKQKQYWPIWNVRWCTKLLKSKVISDYIKETYGDFKNITQFIGYAYDERQRVKKDTRNRKYRYPLIENKITEKKALKLCHKYKWDWGDLYIHFERLGCSICPLMNNKYKWRLINSYPESVKLIKELEKYTKNKWANKGIDYYVKRFSTYWISNHTDRRWYKENTSRPGVENKQKTK